MYSLELTIVNGHSRESNSVTAGDCKCVDGGPNNSQTLKCTTHALEPNEFGLGRTRVGALTIPISLHFRTSTT